MNYEQKYKEALERARKLATDLPNGRNDRLYHVWDLENIFPELRESEDERIRKGLIKGLSAMRDIHKHQTFSDDAINIDDAIAWLEKQGKQSDYNPYKATVESIASMVEKYANGGDLEDFYNNIKVKCKDAMEYDKTWTERQGEQKPSNKVKSKFKVGDWIINNDKRIAVPEQILKVEKYGYLTSKGYISFDKVKTDYHLWTIQDAKEGDVLFSGNPFIFRNFGDKRHPNSPTAYCGINSSDNFVLSTGIYWWTENDVYPASKEQYDLLFQKMKEVGYEWDAEKKEVNKIKQNPIPKFKIGDTIHKIGENTVFPRTIEKIEDGDYVCNNSHSFVNIKFQDDYELVEQKSVDKDEPRFEVGDCIRYRGDNYKIKDIETTKHGFIYNVAVIGKPSDSEEVKTAIGCAAEKDIVKIEQSSTDWSEEDEDARDIAIRIIQNGVDDCAGILDSDKALNWLKSIKPQPHWKPSKEQMEAIKYFIDFHRPQANASIEGWSEFKHLESLYNDIEKL